MNECLLLGIGIGWFAHLLLFGRRPDDSAGDITIEPKRPTRVVRPGEHGGYTPNGPPVDWSKVDTRGIRSAVVPPQPTGIIPGRPGQEVNSGGDTFIPPLRPAPNPRLKDRG